MAEHPHDDLLAKLLQRSAALRYKSGALCQRAASTLASAAAAHRRAIDLNVQRLAIERELSIFEDSDDFDGP